MKIIVVLACLFAQAGYAQTVAVKAGHLVRPDIGMVTESQIILIVDGKIRAVGEDVSIPPSAQIIDLADSWVMPGLIDAHVHLTLNGDPGESLEQIYATESTAFRAIKGLRNARLMLEAGFTTVKDIGNDGQYATADIRRTIELGWYEGPTIVYAGKIIAPFGGQSHDTPPEQGGIWRYEYLDADGPAEIRKAVRQNIFYGATTIKLVSDNSRFFYSEEEVRAAVVEAHGAGLTITIHVENGGEAAKNAIVAGVDAIEHGFTLSDELLKLMKKNGTYLVGTDFPVHHLESIGMIEIDPAEVGAQIVDRLKRAYEIGVPMAFGTDVVVNLEGKERGEMAMEYLDVWIQAEIPPAHILRCMTTNAAALLQLENERGAISPGFYADLVAMPANPLENINALRNLNFVMKDGKVIRHE